MSRDPEVLDKLERPTAFRDNNIKFKKKLITGGGPDTDIEILTIPLSFDLRSTVSSQNIISKYFSITENMYSLTNHNYRNS